jgi:hypothetical protein
MFVPDTASSVADGWFYTIFPPDGWEEGNVIDGVSWSGGRNT